MIFTHLIISATKHLLSFEAISVNNAKKINNDINFLFSQQRCNNYNTKDKDYIIEQKIDCSCDRFHACNTCKNSIISCLNAFKICFSCLNQSKIN